MCSCSEEGQATVEAAFLLPVLMLVLGLLLQPSLLLYNRCVMLAAASEGCRAVATSTASDRVVTSYIQRRLLPIPKLAAFHVGSEAAWEVEWKKNAHGSAQVKLSHKVHPLPLFGVLAGLVSTVDGEGNIAQEVETTAEVVPAWAQASGSGPEDWIAKWK